MYIKNGKEDKEFTGLAYGDSGRWYIVDGQVDDSYTGLVLYNDIWKYVESGYVIEKYTGFARNEFAFWYLEDGNIAWDVTGIIEDDSGKWYVENGDVQQDYYGYYTAADGKQYVITEGFATEKDEYDVINDIKYSSLYKKSIFCAGDSIALGYGNNYYSYADLLADRYSMDMDKSAIGGISIADIKDKESINKLVINNMKKKYDYAILEGGWNDFNLDVAIGELSDDKSDDKTDSKINNKAEGKNNDKNSSPDNDKNEDISQDKELDTTTLIGALENMFKYVKTNHEDTKVYFLMVHKIDETNGKKVNALGLTFKDYYNAIIKVCDKYSIEVIDIYKTSEFNTSEAEYKEATFNGDGVHPVQRAFYKYYLPVIERYMKYSD